MSLLVEPEIPPIHQDADGTVRVGKTRVLLELVIQAYQDGATPEGIVQRYATLELGDVYAVIAYYLHHRAEAERYLAEREERAGRVRAQIEVPSDLDEIRKRLQAARQS